MKQLRILLFFGILSTSCIKKTDSDPVISLRSREHRLFGKWILTQHSYVNDQKVNTYSKPVTINIEICKNKMWYGYDSVWNKSVKIGEWNWSLETERKKSKTILILGYQSNSIPAATYHILERLSYSQIRTREYFDVSDEKRYMIYEWKRRE
jgi:hypothetical protein